MYKLKLNKEETALFLQDTPLLNREMLVYLRKERNGFYTFYSASGLTSDMVANRVAIEILDLCDSKGLTVSDILEHMATKYPNQKRDTLLKDIAYTLFSFSKMSIIVWKGKNPFMKKEKVTVDDYVIELCTEESLLTIKKFVHDNSADQGFMTMVPPPHKLSVYEDEVALRYKLFSNMEDFFFIRRKDDEQLIGLISFSMLGEVETTVCATGLIMCPTEAFERTIKTICCLYKDICVKTINKVKIITTAAEVSAISRNILGGGFTLEATLKAEAPGDDDICLYSFFFE